jgi:6-pyruvoyl-tetrahydropterin synthase
LDACNWVLDFGSLKDVKQMLFSTFDHTLAVAQSDPMADVLVQLESKYRVASVILFEEVGCEAFARHVFGCVNTWLTKQAWNDGRRVWLSRVRVSEHNGNNAEYIGEYDLDGSWVEDK